MKTLLQGNVFDTIHQIDDNTIQCVVTSPPYYALRNYLSDDDPHKKYEIGSEPTYQAYLQNLRTLMNEIKRILRPDGTVWINLGDTYSNAGTSTLTQTLEKDRPKHQKLEPIKASKPKYQREQDPKYTQTTKHHDITRVSQQKQDIKTKSRIGIPERFYINCIDDGWIARNHIIWYKISHLPSPVTDRFTNAHESIFFLTKQRKYYFDLDSIRLSHRSVDGKFKKFMRHQQYDRFTDEKLRVHQKNDKHDTCVDDKVSSSRLHSTTSPYHENGRNPGDVWEYANANYHGQHFASYPPNMIERIILCSTKKGDTVFDPFMGSGTTAFVAQKNNRSWIGCELNSEYCKQINSRTHMEGGIQDWS